MKNIRIFEILLKIAYLAMSLYLLMTSISSESNAIFIAISLLLGITLISNSKYPSYTYPARYKYNNRVIIMRRIEGGLIIAFAVVLAYAAFA